MDKRDIRRAMREHKKAIPMEEKLRRSDIIAHRLEALPRFAEAKVVLLYWSMDDEVQTHHLVERIYRHRTVLLPCVDGDLLRLRQYTGPDCMKAGEQFGIGEPTGPEWTDIDAIDCIAVPGVAFDRQGNRMGRGRGFYDRLLKTTPHAFKVGLAFDFQIMDHIPVEAHDVPMDIVVSDSPDDGPTNPATT